MDSRAYNLRLGDAVPRKLELGLKHVTSIALTKKGVKVTFDDGSNEVYDKYKTVHVFDRERVA